MYKLCFFVPESDLGKVKQAVFDAGAGRMGDYDSCCWQVMGQGQFRPLKGSDPYLGQVGKLETVAEYRVETLCSADVIRDVVKALRQVHPYEEPAFDVWQLTQELMK
ncbi:MAG TPA: NGG1p interacting factor NIF3 [Pseudomonas xinjiangensis]|uniref:NGG1p interacting factor NIF3 n=2 Tax=root TaxID=1 RepID=A0A7V1BMZ4_9GAMM|nr:NGG1p interacting factor NIF3 [Halopseudomonas xinjiangensis]HEC46850.1 NGG1p interacting factor NIF3 [Halopseudomonas xinjiangensis]